MKSYPSVSCLCVTRNRRVFLDRAINYFERSSYPGDLELVIQDGSDESRSYPHRTDHEPAPVRAQGRRFDLGASRCEGEVIVYWDDDDWQSPERIVRQVGLLVQEEADLVVNSRYYCHSILDRKSTRSASWSSTEPAGKGTSFVFRRSTWEKYHFQDLPYAADNRFFSDILAGGGKIVDARDPTLQVYMRHNSNVSACNLPEYSEEATRETRALLESYGDLDFYDGLSELLAVNQAAQPWRKRYPGMGVPPHPGLAKRW